MDLVNVQSIKSLTTICNELNQFGSNSNLWSKIVNGEVIEHVLSQETSKIDALLTHSLGDFHKLYIADRGERGMYFV